MPFSPCETSTRMNSPRMSSLYFLREQAEPLATSSVSCQSGEPWALHVFTWFITLPFIVVTRPFHVNAMLVFPLSCVYFPCC